MYVRTWFGLFTVQNEKIVHCNIFPKDTRSLAERMQETPTALSEGQICNTDLPSLAIHHGFVNTTQEYYSLLHKTTLKLAKNKIKSQWKKDEQVIQSINTIDELDETINLLQERLNRMYTIHFPEHEQQGEKLAQLITTYANKNKIPAGHQLHGKARNSTGMELTSREEQLQQTLAKNILNLYALRHQNEEYLTSTLPDLAPNLTDLIGPILAARMISLNGSLEKLAHQPASTIQVIGANKALFKHLRKNTPPPKHGIIYQHPLIKTAHPNLRGKASRILATKIAIAARTDVYNGKLNPVIKQKLEKQITHLKEQKNNTKPKKQKKTPQRLK